MASPERELDLRHRPMNVADFEAWVQIPEMLDRPARVRRRAVSKPDHEQASWNSSHVSARESSPLVEIEETWAMAPLAEDWPRRRDEASRVSSLYVEQDYAVVLVARMDASIEVDEEEVETSVAHPPAEVCT